MTFSQTSAHGYERTFGHTLNHVRFAPKSGHRGRSGYMSADDPKRTLPYASKPIGKTLSLFVKIRDKGWTTLAGRVMVEQAVEGHDV